MNSHEQPGWPFSLLNDEQMVATGWGLSTNQLCFLGPLLRWFTLSWESVCCWKDVFHLIHRNPWEPRNFIFSDYFTHMFSQKNPHVSWIFWGPYRMWWFFEGQPSPAKLNIGSCKSRGKTPSTQLKWSHVDWGKMGKCFPPPKWAVERFGGNWRFLTTGGHSMGPMLKGIWNWMLKSMGWFFEGFIFLKKNDIFIFSKKR